MLAWLRTVWFGPSNALTADTPPHQGNTSPGDAREAWNLLTLVNKWVNHAEVKLGVVLAFLGVLAAALVALVMEAQSPSHLMLALEGVAGVFLLLAAGSASLGLLPQFKHESDAACMNPLYYSDIAHHFSGKEDEYVGHLGDTLSDPATLLRHIARQTLANSVVASRKYIWVNRAVLLGLVALVATVAVVVGLVLGW